MYHLLSKEAASANSCRAMETRDHTKNGVSPKDQMSRGNQLKIFFVIFLCSIFVLTTFNSCDKSKKMDGTNWEGDCDFVDSYDGEKYSGTISISFAGDEADIVAKFKIKDIYYGDSWNEIYKGTATYTLDKKDINIKIKWKEDYDIDYLDDGRWRGTIDKTTMTLKNVFGETVKFKKQ